MEYGPVIPALLQAKPTRDQDATDLAVEGDGTAGQPMADAFDPADQPGRQQSATVWKAKQTNGRVSTPLPGSRAWATWICARLDGWTGYYGKPGPIVIHSGRIQLTAMLHGWKLKHDV